MGDEGQKAPDVDQDPDVLAEAKKNRIWHLRLERYKDLALGISIILQTFKAEAISLVSGAGTLVLGWFQVRKWIAQGRHEVAQVSEPRPTAMALHHKPRKAEMPVAPVSSLLEGIQGVPDTTETTVPNTILGDPMNYFPAITLVVFVWSSVVVWFKRKKKLEGGK